MEWIMSDPRKNKKYLIKVFGGDREIYKEFLELYDQAVDEGWFYPDEIAWIRFRKIYHETESGWMRI